MNFHHPARHLMILLAKGVLEMVENQEQSEASGTDQRELETEKEDYDGANEPKQNGSALCGEDTGRRDNFSPLHLPG